MKGFIKNRKHETRGFSLIEIIVVVAIASSLIFVVSSFSNNLNILQNIISQKLQSHADVDQTLQIVTTEIRSAGPSSLGAYPINSASSSSFSFYSDIDKDGLFERIRYFLATSSVQKGVIKPTGNPLTYATSSEIVKNVVANVVVVTSTPLFTYYGPNFSGSEPALTSTLDVSQIRVIKMSFYSDVTPGKSPRPTFFSDTIDIRNLRSN